MRSLTWSLLLGTLLALIGLGWALDHLYLRLAQSTQAESPAASGGLPAYEKLGRDLAMAVDRSVHPEAWLQHWPESSTLQPVLIPRDALPLPPELSNQFSVEQPLVLESESGLSLYYPVAVHDLILQIELPAWSGAQNRGLSILLTLAFYLAVALLLIGWLYPLVKRLLALRRSAQAFGQGKLDTRIDVRGFSYIADIETEFNHMAARIQQLIDDNKLISSAMSHDLRTPLARLRFGIDTLSERFDERYPGKASEPLLSPTPTDSPQQPHPRFINVPANLNDANAHGQKAGAALLHNTASMDHSEILREQQYLQRLNNDVAEMEKLVAALLSFARLDHVLHGSQRERVDLAQVLQECCELHQQKVLSIEIDYHPAWIDGNSQFLSTLINNLLSNAHRHATLQVSVSLRLDPTSSNSATSPDRKSANSGRPATPAGGLAPENTSLLLCIEDDGPGIAASDRARMLKPFQRGAGSAGSDTPPESHTAAEGHGLGLAIVDRIAHWHAADLTVGDSSVLGGARFCLRFPLSTTSNVS